MRKILIIVLASIALVCAACVVAAFALAPKPAIAAGHQLPTVRPSAANPATTPTATPAPIGTSYTTDATIGDIPTWITPSRELTRAHSIHVWLATATCMHKLGYHDFHYRVFWLPAPVSADAENFWTDGMSSAGTTKALTDEFGPTHISESSSGCHGRALVSLQHQFLDGH
ncbi:MAG TPA: hypothetical protein VGF80_09760 [Galbitalea sp.]|jgi:hypothetical protein